jgi:hypothetical protein
MTGMCALLKSMTTEDFYLNYLSKTDFKYSKKERVESLASAQLDPYHSAPGREQSNSVMYHSLYHGFSLDGFFGSILIQWSSNSVIFLDPGITEITPRGYFFPVKELDREMLSVKTHCNFPASLKVLFTLMTPLVEVPIMRFGPVLLPLVSV